MMSSITEIANSLAGYMYTPTCTDGLSGYVTTTTGMDGCTDWIPSYTYNNWWPMYWPTVYEDKTAKAFKVVKVLMDKKAIKLTTIKQFVDLVDEVVKAL